MWCCVTAQMITAVLTFMHVRLTCKALCSVPLGAVRNCLSLAGRPWDIWHDHGFGAGLDCPVR